MIQKKMPGDEQEQFANLRLLYTYMFTHPGGKLLFMGDEFGSSEEWNYKSELSWGLLQDPKHSMLQSGVRDLNRLLRHEPALYEKQFDPSGFEWTDTNQSEELVLLYRRKGVSAADDVVVILNLGNAAHKGWKVNVNGKESWSVIFNSNGQKYGGNGQPANLIIADKIQHPAKALELSIDLPAFSGLVLK